MGRLLRYLSPPPSTCSACHRVLRERRRRPCPSCGSLARTFSMSLIDSTHVEVKSN